MGDYQGSQKRNTFPWNKWPSCEGRVIYRQHRGLEKPEFRKTGSFECHEQYPGCFKLLWSLPLSVCWDAGHNGVSEGWTARSRSLGDGWTLKHWWLEKKEFLKGRSWQSAELQEPPSGVAFPQRGMLEICHRNMRQAWSGISEISDRMWKLTFVIFFLIGKRIMSFYISSNWMPSAGIKSSSIWNRVLYLGQKVNCWGWGV